MLNQYFFDIFHNLGFFWTLFALLVLSLFALNGPVSQDPYLDLDALGMLAHQGMEGEIHHVETEDGYILQVHRVKSSKPAKGIAAPVRPVVLMHGMIGSARSFLLIDNSIVKELNSKNLDVWLANNRGSVYGRNHTSLDPLDYPYWKFDWTHMAKFDFPATLSAVTSKTGSDEVDIICYSQGCVVAAAALAENPQLEVKINKIYALGPIIYTSRFGGFTGLFADSWMKYMTRLVGYSLPMHEIMRQTEGRRIMARNFGAVECKIVHFFYQVLVGTVNNGIPEYICKRIFYHVPSGLSLMTLDLYAQLNERQTFAKFDHGQRKNLEIYGTTNPPEFNLSNVRVPIEVYVGELDGFISPEVVERKLLPQLSGLKRYEVLENFGHWGYLWREDAREKLYSKLSQRLLASDGSGQLSANKLS